LIPWRSSISRKAFATRHRAGGHKKWPTHTTGARDRYAIDSWVTVKHDDHLKVNSVSGGSATFRNWLPVIEAVEVATLPAAPALAASRLRPCKSW